MEAFKKLGLSENSVLALKKKGFTTPTSIQAKVIPKLLDGKKDIVGQSQTGTGKTAAFGLPILEKIKENSRTIQAIILVPTRELALQVAGEIDSLKGNKKIKILSVYGGAPIGNQRQKLREGIDIVVGTPGRVMDLQRRKSLVLDNIKFAVLDEADEMLNMGFVEDIEDILKNTPKDKSMLLFSATMPKAILKIAERYMREYDFIEVEKADVITKTVEQIYYNVNARDRVEAIKRVIDYYVDFRGIIFCNTRASVDTLAHQLTNMNYNAAALHGDITQGQREKILGQFRNRNIKVLVATDVAARGIDVTDLTHVINYSLPQSPESYVHRIGRTGRAGKTGIAITFVIPSERRQLGFVEKINSCKLTKQSIPSAKDIIQNKGAQVTAAIKNIIDVNAGKSTKYDSMAKDLLKEYQPEEVISALLIYGLKNELDFKSYKDISEPKPSAKHMDSGRSNFRSGRIRARPNRDNSRSRRNSDRSRSRDRGSNDDRPRRSRSSEGRSESRRSERPREGRSDRDSPRRSRSRENRTDRPRSRENRTDRPRSRENRTDRPRSTGDRSERPRFNRSDRSRPDGRRTNNSSSSDKPEKREKKYKPSGSKRKRK